MSNDRPTGDVAVALSLIAGATVLGGITLALRRPKAAIRTPFATVRSARRLNRAAGTLAASVLADSAIEHYRGNFHNKAMVTPLVAASLSLAASLHGTADSKGEAHVMRDIIYGGAGLTGLVGIGFHIYNISKKPGGPSWQNLFYSAPLGAPVAISLSGMLGFLSERLRDNPPDRSPRILGIPAGRVIGVMTSLGLMGTASESALLHFRGAYHNPAMYLPVTMPPVAAVLLGASALGKTSIHRPLARWWMRITALLGFAGTAFHAVGVGRAMGGWRNWRQNLVDGPPIPAPPSFTGLAMAGLAALALLEDHPDD